MGASFSERLRPTRRLFRFRSMSFGQRFILFALVIGLGTVLSGCAPSGSDQDDKKEPHFLLGKSRVSAMDYQGAIEAFEQSLEVNPHSAAAHLELGWLYDEKASDAAAAIYHYQQYLKFYPDADNAEVIKQRIYTCKQQLAADVLPLPSAPAAQQQLQQLADKNRQLQDELDKWRAYYQNQQLAAQSQSNVVSLPQDVTLAQNNTPAPAPVVTNRVIAPRPAVVSTARKYTIASGDTGAGIARKFKIKLSVLQAANPGVNLAKIRVGQVLNLPPSS